MSLLKETPQENSSANEGIVSFVGRHSELLKNMFWMVKNPKFLNSAEAVVLVHEMGGCGKSMNKYKEPLGSPFHFKIPQTEELPQKKQLSFPPQPQGNFADEEEAVAQPLNQLFNPNPSTP